ncbi:ATP-binding cassette domain-containing protein [Paenibacillus sp.]|jgi:ABC-2 type transport system ATP-binding protein|uniref:ATP-binding cassette domain-containing protein n=1 Tax=Paenibacillus sp. TaxID=58172 RepID=UPI00281D4578|nr:AAA family ATPase [Paenibacillus sp.]MDR0267852.1 ATP-binding cassette domain-containing protein [Paenibacillus sp.]
MISIKNLNFSYKGSNRANINNLTVDFKPGTINVLIGKNGSGKTTLFDLITNIIKRPGEITGVPEEKEIIYQLQGLFFPSILKGKDIFRFFLYTDFKNEIKLGKTPYIDQYMSPSEIDLMERVWNTEFGQLSIGERRYLSILAITLMKRKLYIFDEPTSGVDPESRIQVLKRIEEITKTDSIVLLSTHTLHEFENINCKLHLLHKGNIRFMGTYEEFIKDNESRNPDISFYEKVREEA